ncbi:hypothetical protein DL89DRAFT_265142 [Linderina pennispora]|uniref:SCP domain-containing protein n=1 Tax=Linderina pennispora TaxID=61395 RepID=A0A1Y1WHE1_9FUNG|nr:uncharacterized protein DL89DRAFT_265142 [Linderina pennispora]ORX72980.1 hypothetical protein DL89DRAFT_265142 [Linderina pennispora]
MTYIRHLFILALLVSLLDQVLGEKASAYAAKAPAPEGSSRLASNWRGQMLAILNQERAKHGKSPVIMDYRLNAAAQRHSDYQFSSGMMTHDDPAGTLGARASVAGIEWRGVAENVAHDQQSVGEVMTAWIHSPMHLSNMLGDYNIVGFGEHSLYWTQMFAKT